MASTEFVSASSEHVSWSSSVPSPGTDYTMSVWVKFDANKTGGIFCFETSANTGFRIQSVFVTNLFIRCYHGDGSTFTDSGTLSTGTWYNVVASSSAGDNRLYVNGTKTTSSGTATPITPDTARIANNVTANSYGDIHACHAALYDFQMTDEEAAELEDFSPLLVQPAHLDWLWEGQTTSYHEVRSGADGTASGTPVVDDTDSPELIFPDPIIHLPSTPQAAVVPRLALLGVGV